MRIAVVGSGSVGRALMGRLAGTHDVVLGARDPAATAAGDPLPGGVEVAALPDALAGADVVIVAIPGKGIPAFVGEHGARMAGAVAIDASNDLSGGPGGAMHHLDAWAERAPGVPVARAFCSLGWENIAEPSYDGVAATMFWCGPDGEAGERVETVIRDVGFDPVRIGGADAAGVLDGVARLWFQLAFSEGLGRALGFRLLRRDG